MPAQRVLYHSDIRPAFKQVRSEGMAQLMGRHVRRQPGLDQVAFEAPAGGPVGQELAPAVEKDQGPGPQQAAVDQEAVEGDYHSLGQWDDAFLVQLTGTAVGHFGGLCTRCMRSASASSSNAGSSILCAAFTPRPESSGARARTGRASENSMTLGMTPAFSAAATRQSARARVRLSDGANALGGKTWPPPSSTKAAT